MMVILKVTGPSGCGKTQFCLMMSVLATLPISMGGLDGAVIYIDTESAFGAERLVEIAEHRFPNYFGTEEKLFSMTRSIHLYRELTCDSVLKRIETLEEEIISKKVKLVIIDSVASVVRKEFDMKLQGNLMERSNFLAREASLLKYLAEEFSIPVILTNQITTRLSSGLDIQADLVSPADDLSLSEVSGASGSKDREPGYVTAALGNTWSHSVNTRLILQYHDLHTRQVLVAKSPVAPFSAFFYTIENSGLVLQDGETEVQKTTHPLCNSVESQQGCICLREDGKDHPDASWEGSSPVLQAIRVRTNILKDGFPSSTAETLKLAQPI
ncbi:DNA repair protein RAD51 homolog 2 isoform X12 [Chrysemys picta bellii]|uniref:DNA repair protein RAD51 homolog 2 isoform X12 n=1 Tax=Chrysemys picta bellii TaxID=8478 RepID=UPI0032B1E1A5